MFRHTGRSSVIRDIGLTEVNLTGGNDVGALAGYGFGKIIASYASGAISGRLSVGGLIGTNEGGITVSYSRVNVQGIGHVGGLVGWNAGSIDASYAVGKVAGVRHNTGGCPELILGASELATGIGRPLVRRRQQGEKARPQSSCKRPPVTPGFTAIGMWTWMATLFLTTLGTSATHANTPC